ncbi:MAG: hypothetical protein TEF_01210 [Rhizobiales bacterium NRL2]|jgi:carbonic anhydrase|nr:MAG: hypothetical protein TEF_01210 [Rhizobiales bacterium NRL2]
MIIGKPLAAIGFAAAMGAAAAWAADTHWSYAGADGPAQWAALSESFAACGGGVQQSPVDIVEPDSVEAELEEIELAWNAGAAWTVLNNGHTIQVQAPDAGHAVIDGERFDLLQFHFHSPSEHAIDGERWPMEVHFVHAAEDGRLAVIGVMMSGGGANGLFERVMDAAPAAKGEAALGAADARALMPGDDDFFRYQGSLTTPPCSEIVLWSVMEGSVAVSDGAIAKFRDIHAMNARPLQPLNRRYVLQD